MLPMAHVAFSIAPYAGHINPSLAVVAELARRGHRVSYATTEQFAADVRAAGAEPVLHQTTLGRPADGRPPGGGAARLHGTLQPVRSQDAGLQVRQPISHPGRTGRGLGLGASG